MPIWPFGTRPDDEVVEPPSVLDAIDANTPHRFRFWLADAAQGDAVVKTLHERLANEFTVEAFAEPDGGVRLEVVSTFTPGSAAIFRPLNVLRGAGVEVRGLEVLDLVTDVDASSLRRAVEDWGQFANKGPYRLRLEKLAGMPVLEMCLAELGRSSGTGPDRPAAWSFAVRCVAFNTPGAEGRLLTDAAQVRGAREADAFVDAAVDRINLSALTGQSIAVPADTLAALIGRPGYVSERASHLAWLLPSPLPPAVARALGEVTRVGGERAVAAVGALQNAEPSTSVRGAVEAALASGEPNLQAAALETLAALWATDARAAWKEFLASRSVPMRWAAEAVLGLHGTEEDLADAAAHLGKLARTKSSVEMSPPRGNEIVDLLVRHRDHPVAQAGLDDLSARWDRLGADLRGWLAEHHPWLDPAVRVDRPTEAVGEPEETLAWPAPTIERDGDSLTLWFDEGAAHSEAREQFETLASGHPLVEVLDGDREWLSVRIASPDPEQVVQALWESASATSTA